MLEISVSKRILVIDGERIEISPELTRWLQKYTTIETIYKGISQ